MEQNPDTSVDMSHLNDCYTDQDTGENYLKLHKAIEEGNTERVKDIIKNEKDKYILIENEDGEIPLHLACKYKKNNDIVEHLLGLSEESKSVISSENKEQQLEMKNKIYGNTPLHIAACLGNTDIVKTIIEKCENSESLLKELNTLKDTPVHSAASRGHVEILEIMLKKCPGCIHLEGRFNGLPLHTACGYGYKSAAQKLLEKRSRPDEVNVIKTLEGQSNEVVLPAFTSTTEPQKIKQEDREKMKECIKKLSEAESKRTKKHYCTPLTRACQFGHHDIVEYLLQEQATAHPRALIKAIEGLYKHCVELLLFKGAFRKDLLRHSYITDGSVMPTTPFRELIKHMPDVAEKVIQKCVMFERFLVNNKNFKIRFDYELLDDEGKQWRRKENNIASYTSCTPEKNVSVYLETHPLSLMVKYKRGKLLTHPIVAGLIHDKWKSRYGILSFFQWLIYIFILCCTTALLFTLPNPSSYCCKIDIQNQLQSEDGFNTSCSDISPPSSNVECDEDTSYENNITFFTVVNLSYSFLRLIFELFQCIASLRDLKNCCQCCKKNQCLNLLRAIKEVKYLWNPINWIEVTLFVLSFSFCVSVAASQKFDAPFCLLAWQWQIGIVVLLLSWIELFFFSIQFRLIGVHALMFIRVLKRALSFIPLALLLIVAFGLTFHFLLYQPQLKASPYFTPGFSLLKILSMTAGEIGSNDFFNLDINGQTHDASHLQYMGLSTFIWILSLVLMTILLSNLLIGLAVGDITNIINKAILEKLSLQIEYILTVEHRTRHLAILLWKVCNKCVRHNKVSNNNKVPTYIKEFEPYNTSPCETIINEVIYFLWGGIRYDSKESIAKLVKLSEIKESQK